MMMRNISTSVFALLLILVIVLPLPVLAQGTASAELKHRLKVGIAPSAYYGDLSSDFQKWGALFYAGLRTERNRWLSTYAELSTGYISGQNLSFASAIPEVQVNRSFQTSFISLSYQLQFNLIQKPYYQLYIGQGIGLLRYEPKNSEGLSLSSLVQTRAEDESYGNFTVQLPTSLGFQCMFENQFGAGIELGLLNPRTDYLDNISQLGNPRRKDNMLSVRLSFVAPLAYRSQEEIERRATRQTERAEVVRLRREAIEKEKQQQEAQKAEAQRQKQQAVPEKGGIKLPFRKETTDTPEAKPSVAKPTPQQKSREQQTKARQAQAERAAKAKAKQQKRAQARKEAELKQKTKLKEKQLKEKKATANKKAKEKLKQQKVKQAGKEKQAKAKAKQKDKQAQAKAKQKAKKSKAKQKAADKKARDKEKQKKKAEAQKVRSKKN